MVAITYSLPPFSDFRIRQLPPQHIGLFVRAGHPLLAIGRRSMRTHLFDYRLASTHLPPRAMEQLARLFGVSNKETVPVALECNSIATLLNVALGSDVIMLSAREAIREPLAEKRIVQLPLSYYDDATLPCNVISHARRELTPSAQKVVNLIDKLMREGMSGLPGST